MPRVTITTICQATVTEEWVLDVTEQELALVQQDETAALDLIRTGGGTLISVRNVAVTDEHDRDVESVERTDDAQLEIATADGA